MTKLVLLCVVVLFCFDSVLSQTTVALPTACGPLNGDTTYTVDTDFSILDPGYPFNHSLRLDSHQRIAQLASPRVVKRPTNTKWLILTYSLLVIHCLVAHPPSPHHTKRSAVSRACMYTSALVYFRALRNNHLPKRKALCNTLVEVRC